MNGLSSTFLELADLAKRLKVPALNTLPGLWELALDEHWWFAVNGKREALKSSRGAKVEPYTCYVEFNGWPAGVFSPQGGVIAAGSLANEKAFVKAIREFPAEAARRETRRRQVSTAAERKAEYEGSALEALMKASGHEICPKCYCCDLVDESAPCWQCGGFDYEDEDDYGPCSVCQGEGEIYWKACIGRCDENGEHPVAERGAGGEVGNG